MPEIDTQVPTAVGDLGAIIRLPDHNEPLPGVVLVDGSGDGDRLDYGGWPEWIGQAGSVTLRHDKPGCGGSPGHWTAQSFEDRAEESLAALNVLREHPATAGQKVGLYGISQGGWVALLAAALAPEEVDFVICHSGPGTSPAVQERDRLNKELAEAGHPEAIEAEAMAWVDERLERLRGGEDIEGILADQSRLADRPWYSTVTFAGNTVAELEFFRRILDFDPAHVLPQVHCPLLALFGGADSLVPVQESLAIFAEHLPPAPADHGFVVFPGANHGLFIADPDPAIPRRDQLAPGYLAIIESFLRDRQQAAQTLVTA
ncbi:alpha/beta hydrolase family protein [Natronoglycomyces albus]|uniref:Alpha/beta hydrolase n=1 Tax=Natronoglycomyces albus TaxID=2811108 RepID=A0A895XQ44_9ACTN|nr:alpha/beta hydrolase [Natronoglycomyces albus]QSB04666.1 alpha/beta hydrolase [Natronoglycomyces albus]